MVLKSPGPYPTGMAFDGKNLWIADFEKDRIFKLAWRDNEKYTVKDTKRFRMTFRHLLRNTGSGTIKSAKAFLAVPDETQENLKILEPLEFDPKPSKMDRDRWGQEVAVFEFKDVAPGKETRAEYRTEIEIGELNFLIFPDKAGTLDEIPSEIREKYTADGSRYRIKDPIIADTAREIVGKERNAYRVGRKIFQWVIEKLEYEMVGGWDAPEVLIKRGTGSCSEYAFLYIALCHAAGLPARYEGSVAQRGDNASIDDVFHRWCEIYLPGYGWIPVDPSGGDQKWPADQARYFGHLRNKYFVTTRGAGDSEYLGWNYNYNSEYTYEGQGDVYEEAWGLWEPITDEKEKVTGGSEAACP
jgi:transglutaminase-like putative cysteine protease